VRASVLGWSTVSGAVMGLLAGAVLAAALYGLLYLPPLRASAFIERVRLPAAVTVLVLATAIGGVLGWLEGRLKLQ
jgi:hypothetical protein